MKPIELFTAADWANLAEFTAAALVWVVFIAYVWFNRADLVEDEDAADTRTGRIRGDW